MNYLRDSDDTEDSTVDSNNTNEQSSNENSTGISMDTTIISDSSSELKVIKSQSLLFNEELSKLILEYKEKEKHDTEQKKSNLFVTKYDKKETKVELFKEVLIPQKKDPEIISENYSFLIYFSVVLVISLIVYMGYRMFSLEKKHG